MVDPTIITCAVTGSQTTLAQNPNLPCTPEQIAAACIGAARAGAAIVHVHVRYPDGRPSTELKHYREVVERIRASDTDVVINLTTGPGGRFMPSEEDPKVAAEGTNLTVPQNRVQHILALRPEICSLDLNTMYSGRSVVMNIPKNVRIMANMICEVGTFPELEVFDSGDIHLGRDLVADGTVPSPPLFQIVLGVKYGADATPRTMAYMSSLLPVGSHWAAFGIGRWAFPMVAQAFLLGGHVRIGLEDSVRLEKAVLAPDNAAMVEKASRIVRDLGGQLATPAQVREMLNLKRMKPVEAEV